MNRAITQIVKEIEDKKLEIKKENFYDSRIIEALK